jgi:hypothetical protein
VKIGVSCDPIGRLGVLQTGSGEPLILIGWADFSDCHPAEVRAMERDLHRCFEPWRLSGEWFSAIPEILQFAQETSHMETLHSVRLART